MAIAYLEILNENMEELPKVTNLRLLEKICILLLKLCFYGTRCKFSHCLVQKIYCAGLISFPFQRKEFGYWSTCPKAYTKKNSIIRLKLVALFANIKLCMAKLTSQNYDSWNQIKWSERHRQWTTKSARFFSPNDQLSPLFSCSELTLTYSEIIDPLQWIWETGSKIFWSRLK